MRRCSLSNLPTIEMASALLRGADPLATNDGVLPTDVLREILLRVPAKELCRLRLVCRSWRSLTSDPRFATAHSARHPMFVGVLPDTGLDEIHLVDLHCSVVKRIRGPKGLCSHLSTQAGLVCVSAEPIDRAAQDLVLNPATGAVSALPVGDRPSMVLACVLGHVPSTGEYKVVRVGNQVEERMKTVFQVVALGGGEQRWRTKPSPVDIITDSRFIAVVSGVAYFMATYDDDEHDDDSGSDMGPELVLFDLATEEWRPTIIYGPLHEADRIQIVSLDECLVIADHKDQDCSMDLWFLMDADNASYWTKRYSMRCAPHFDHAPMYPPRLLVILEDGRIVALLKWKDLLIVYDPKTQTWDDFTTVTYYSAIGMHQGSLLDSDLLAWNLELPSD